MDHISNALGINPVVIESSNNEVVVQDENTLPVVSEQERVVEAEEDFAFARNNLNEIAATAMDSIKDLVEVTKQSQTARSFEALTMLLTTAIEANKAVVEIHQSRKETNTKGNGNVVNNLNVTTAALQEMLKINANK